MAFFTLQPTEVAVPSQPVFTYNLSSNASLYTWDFGDGNTSSQTNPVHYYTTAGVYDVSLVANNQWNCPDTIPLGIAVLMLKGQRASFQGYQRQQALAMAQEMAEKIRANQGWAAFYVTGTTDGSGMPGGETCSPVSTTVQVAVMPWALRSMIWQCGMVCLRARRKARMRQRQLALIRR